MIKKRYNNNDLDELSYDELKRIYLVQKYRSRKNAIYNQFLKASIGVIVGIFISIFAGYIFRTSFEKIIDLKEKRLDLSIAEKKTRNSNLKIELDSLQNENAKLNEQMNLLDKEIQTRNECLEDNTNTNVLIEINGSKKASLWSIDIFTFPSSAKVTVLDIYDNTFVFPSNNYDFLLSKDIEIEEFDPLPESKTNEYAFSPCRISGFAPLPIAYFLIKVEFSKKVEYRLVHINLASYEN